MAMTTDEHEYLNLVRRVLQDGTPRTDRTGTGTLSLFGAQMRFSLRDNTMPLLTTKAVNWKAVVEELLWFISGSTDSKDLEAKGVNIWKANSSPEFLATRGLQGMYPEGFLGPVYGFQWRHFGAPYDPDHDDGNQGVDQLQEVIRLIKEEPDSRRILMSAWNPVDLPKMALPPCHVLCQFYVNTSTNELSCQLYQRSGDLGLGVPFNIASYALLTHMIAHVCGLKAGEFVHTLGDAHIYKNHIEPLQEQILRTPTAFPKVQLDPTITDIDQFTSAHIALVDYNPQGRIKMKMAV